MLPPPTLAAERLMLTLPRLTRQLPATLHLPGPPPVTVELRRSLRARRMSLRVGRPGVSPVLTLPPGATQREAQSFLAAQEGWLRGALARRPPVQRPAIGCVVPVEGRPLHLKQGGGRRVQIDGTALMVPGPGDPTPRVAAFLRALARDRLAEACDRHAGQLGRPYASLTLRDTRSRWGSCAHDGRLMFSWRLVMAPPEVLDYVAAHEVAHLARMDHSPAFWAVVARLCPDYPARRSWLKRHGADLHLWDLGPAA